MKLSRKGHRQERYICFRVENYREVCRRDKGVIEKLETNLLEAGAIPGRMDVPSRICCATITDPTVRDEDIKKVLEKLGFRVRLLGTDE